MKQYIHFSTINVIQNQQDISAQLFMQFLLRSALYLSHLVFITFSETLPLTYLQHFPNRVCFVFYNVQKLKFGVCQKIKHVLNHWYSIANLCTAFAVINYINL